MRLFAGAIAPNNRYILPQYRLNRRSGAAQGRGSLLVLSHKTAGHCAVTPLRLCLVLKLIGLQQRGLDRSAVGGQHLHRTNA